jgi:hypothetical protein
MQGGEKGAGTHNEHPARDLFDAIGNADAVQWAKCERAENEEIQRALEKIACFLHADDNIVCRYRLSIQGRSTLGSAPGEIAGLCQINAVVPTGVTAGPAVPVVVTAGGRQSPDGVTIAVQ